MIMFIFYILIRNKTSWNKALNKIRLRCIVVLIVLSVNDEIYRLYKKKIKYI